MQSVNECQPIWRIGHLEQGNACHGSNGDNGDVSEYGGHENAEGPEHRVPNASFMAWHSLQRMGSEPSKGDHERGLPSNLVLEDGKYDGSSNVARLEPWVWAI